jgi:hypothetical protein
MRTRAELIKLAVERLLDVFEAFERKPDPPALTSEPPEPEPAPHTRFKPGSQEWYRALPRGQMGGGLTQNEIARGVPKRRPPRRPGQQQRHWSGVHWYY